MESRRISIPLNVVHEEVVDQLQGAFEAYLFGEPGDVVQTMGHRHGKWLVESARRPIT